MGGIHKGIRCVPEASANCLLYHHVVTLDSVSSTLMAGSSTSLLTGQMVDLRTDIPPEWYLWLDHTISAVSGHLVEDRLLLAAHLHGHEAYQICLEEHDIQSL